MQLAERRDAMLRGEPINTSEGRAVLHTALRAPHGAGPHSDAVHDMLDRFLAYAEQVRDTASSGFTDVVNIGIGGSDLGPQMAVPALDAWCHPGLRLHFVSNVDGHDITPVLRRLDPTRTLFIVASKTFTTQETMANAQVARPGSWRRGHRPGPALRRGDDQPGCRRRIRHPPHLRLLGLGGRSLFAVERHRPAHRHRHRGRELPGPAGRRPCDGPPLRRGAAGPEPAVQLGLLDVWYRNFHGFTSRSVAPYHQGCAGCRPICSSWRWNPTASRWTPWGALTQATSPVVWGEPGTNGQHAYFQMLHQGTDVVPVEFIAVKRPTHEHADLHTKLLANCLAQSQALMLGKTAAQAATERAPTASPDLAPEVLAQQRSFPGNRPSTTLLLDELTPAPWAP
jgi:glucose-6-phosphate isomerase